MYNVLSLVCVTFFGCLCGYSVSSIGNSQTVHDRAKGVIHVNEPAAEKVTTNVVTPKRKLKKVTRGIASWYGDRFHGKLMANSKPFDKNKATVAHRGFWKFPPGTYFRVTSIDTGKVIVVPLTDRGPFIMEEGRYSRDIDLSEKAAKDLDPLYKRKGLLNVRYEIFAA